MLKCLMRTTRILLLLLSWSYFCGPGFSMEGPSNLTSPNEKQNLVINKQNFLVIAIDALDGVTRDLKNIYELLIDAASYLYQNKKLIFNKTKQIDDKLVEEAFRWLGGAIPRGVDESFPEEVLKDKQFQSMHLARAAVFYIDIYIQLKLVRLSLNSPTFYVVDHAYSFLRNNLNYGLNVKQSEYEIGRFGHSKPLDAQSLFGADIERAEDHIRLAILNSIANGMGQPFSATFAAILSRHDLRTFDLKEAFDQHIKNLVNAQTINHSNDIWLDIDSLNEDRLADTENLLMYKSVRDPKNREVLAKRGFLKHFEELVRFVKFVDYEMMSELFPVNLEDQNTRAKKPKRSLSGNKKRSTEKRASRARCKKTNRSQHDADEEFESPMKSDSCAAENKGEELKIDNFATATHEQQTPSCSADAIDNPDENVSATENTARENHPPLLGPDAPKPARANKRDRKEKKKLQQALNHHIVERSTAASLPKMASLHNAVPYFTREVVEKFIDVFGNEEGVRKKRGGGYLRQGWGKLDAFRNALEQAGWLVNQRELDSGLIINEKHGSSTISFQMPFVAGTNRLYIKIHSDHERGLHMRPIARHFITKYASDQGYPEEFWLAYYKEHFKN